MDSTSLWSWPIWGYLWFAGVAGGGYFSAFLIDKQDEAGHGELTRIATILGMPFIFIGCIFLLIDLGHPLRAWHLFVSFNPLSPMWFGSWALFLWSVVAVALIVLWLIQGYRSGAPAAGLLARITSPLLPFSREVNLLAWLNFALSILLIAYTGVLLSTTSRSLWATVFLPALFVVSAVSTGRAAVLGSLVLFGKNTSRPLEKSGAWLIVLEALAILAFLIAVPAGVLISGSLAIYFWLGVIVLGFLLPFGIECCAHRKRANRLLLFVSILFILLGALVLRWIIVIGGQMA
jgi:polysulfide reductase chain C